MNNHGGSWGLSGGLWCCCELGLGTSSQDLLWGMGWGQEYGQHHAPVLDHLCRFRSPRHLLGRAKWAVPCLLSQAGHPNWAGRWQPPPGSKRSPQQVFFFKPEGRCSVWEAGPLRPTPCLGWQGFGRVKEIVQHHCLAGVDLDLPGVLHLERGS